MKQKGGLYWKEGDKVPYCPSCKEKNKKDVHLQKGQGSASWACKSCKNVYET